MREILYSNPRLNPGGKATDMATTETMSEPETTANLDSADVQTPVDASDGIGDDGPLVEGGELDPERAAMKKEADELRAEIKRLELKLSKVDELDMAIIDAGIEVDDLEARISDLDKERKDLKEDLKKAVATLRACVIRRKTGQRELFTEQQKAGEPIAAPEPIIPRDVGGESPISALLAADMKKIVGKEEFQAAKDRGEPIGMTAKQIEVLEGLGWDTIAKMEKGINENAWWHREIKGFGPDKIDRLTITLAAFRRVYPIPTAESVPDNGLVAESLEPAIGEIPAWKLAVEKLDLLIGQATHLENDGPADGIEFATSVREKATDIRAWVTEREHVTTEQETAIDNMAEGIAKWQPQN